MATPMPAQRAGAPRTCQWRTHHRRPAVPVAGSHRLLREEATGHLPLREESTEHRPPAAHPAVVGEPARAVVAEAEVARTSAAVAVAVVVHTSAAVGAAAVADIIDL